MNIPLFIELPEGLLVNKSYVEKVIQKKSGCLIQLKGPKYIETVLGFDDMKKGLQGFAPEFQLQESENPRMSLLKEAS